MRDWLLAGLVVGYVVFLVREVRFQPKRKGWKTRTVVYVMALVALVFLLVVDFFHPFGLVF